MKKSALCSSRQRSELTPNFRLRLNLLMLRRLELLAALGLLLEFFDRLELCKLISNYKTKKRRYEPFCSGF
jgi:hypothetical protein